MSSKTKNGKDFIKLLEEFECSEAKGLQGHDVDWLWETKAGPFMNWVCQNFTTENLLTEKEATNWANFPHEDKLNGPQLNEALDHLKQGSNEANLNKAQDLDQIREEINVKEACLSELDQVGLVYNTDFEI